MVDPRDIASRFDIRKLDRREFLGLTAGAAAILACSPSGGTGSSTGTSGGAKKLADSIVLASQSISDTLDPHGTLSNSGYQTARQTFDALLTYDNSGKLAPQLVTEWKRVDNNTVELKLRDDVKFSNGENFTADTVKFNIERILTSTDPIHASSKTRIATFAGAEVVNPTTVRVKTKVPDALIFNRLTTLFMVPEKYTRDGGDLKTKPIGSGSFKVTEFVVQNRIVYEAWDGTWRGKSTVKQARIVGIPEEAALLSALKTGEVDIVNPVSGDKVPGLKNDFNVVAVSAGSCTVNALFPAFDVYKDKRVREAVNLAVNKEDIIKTIFGGYGKPAGQIMQPGYPGNSDSFKPFPYDPERAKSLIKAAGVEGAEVKIAVVTAIKAYNEAIAGFLTAAGLKAGVQVYEFPVFVPQLTTKSDNAMVSFRTDYFALRDFDAAGANFGARPPGFQRFMNSDEYDKLYVAAQSELDEAKRLQYVLRMEEIMRAEIPVLYLAWQEFPIVFSKKIDKINTHYDTAVYLWEVEKAA